MVDTLRACQVPAHLGERRAVDVKQRVHRALGNVQHGRVRHEVIAHEDAQEDKVVNDALEVERHRQPLDVRLAQQVLTQNAARKCAVCAVAPRACKAPCRRGLQGSAWHVR